jgi:hypothetical protein
MRVLMALITAMYLMCIGALFLGPNTAMINSQPFGYAVIGFIAAAVALHVALVFASPSLRTAVAALLSCAALAELLLMALMKVTGDSL